MDEVADLRNSMSVESARPSLDLRNASQMLEARAIAMQSDHAKVEELLGGATFVIRPVHVDKTSDFLSEEEDIFVDKSLHYFSLENPVRKFCIHLMRSRIFELFSVLVTLVNFAILIPVDPRKGTKDGYNKVEYIANFLFLAYYIFELVVRVIAYGFVMEKFTYLRNPWNWIDIFVIVIGLIFLFPFSSARWSQFRLLRVLRPMRRIKGMRLVLRGLFKAFSKSPPVLAMLSFLLIIFSIMALHMWAGRLRQVCVDDETGLPDEVDRRRCGGGMGRHCTANQTCLRVGENPIEGRQHFDNFGYAMLTLFTLMSTDGWADLFNNVCDSYSIFAVIFFFIFILFVFWMTVNLFIVIIAMGVEEEEEEEEEEKEKAEKAEAAQEAMNSAGTASSESHLTSEVELLPVSQSSDPMKKDLAAKAKEAEEKQKRKKRKRNVKFSDDPFEWLYQKSKKLKKRKHWYYFPSFFKASELRHVFESRRFELLMAFIVAVNVIVMATEHYKQSRGFERTQYWTNVFVTVIFTIEAALKIYAFGVYGYFRKGLNVLDFVITAVSWVDVGLSAHSLSAVRAIRILRVFRILRIFEAFHLVLQTIRKALAAMVAAFIILLLYMLIFTITGRELFAGKVPDESNYSFNTFLKSAYTTFQGMTGAQWSFIMYATMIETGKNISSIYFLITFFVGVFVVLNVFTAVLIANYTALDFVRGRREHVGREEKFQYGKAANWKKRKEKRLLEILEARQKKLADTKFREALQKQHRKQAKNPLGILLQDEYRIVVHGSKLRLQHKELIKSENELYQGKSFFLFGPENRIRKVCLRIISSKIFEWVVVAMVLLSCVMLASEQPSIPSGHPYKKFVRVMDFIFVIFFVAEAVLKSIALGFVMGESTYLRSAWNASDFIVTIASVIALIFPKVRYLRALRGFRPLRLLSQFENTRVVLVAVSSALVKIASVFGVVAVFWCAYALLGLQLFNGLFYSCNDPAAVNVTMCDDALWPTPFLNKEGEEVPRRWANPPWSFDNFGYALESMFHVGFVTQWEFVSTTAMDHTRENWSPRHNAHGVDAIFFAAFILFGTFFALNLFVAAVVSAFTHQIKKLEGTSFLTDEQERWYTWHRVLSSLKPVKPRKPTGNELLDMLSKLVRSEKFKLMVLALVTLNLGLMACYHYEQSKAWTKFLDVINVVFTIVFDIEIILKLIVFRKRFFQKRQLLDLFVAIVTTIPVIADIFGGFSHPVRYLLRSFRALRGFEVVANFPLTKHLVDTFLFAAPSILNVFAVLVVVWFVYAVFGMNLMHDVSIAIETGITRNINFKDFGHSVIAVFRLSVFDDWVTPMYQAREVSRWLDIFFISFVLISALLMVNIFISVVMNQYIMYRAERDDQNLNGKALRRFAKMWLKHVPTASSRMPIENLLPFLKELGPPLGFHKGMYWFEIVTKLWLMCIPISKPTDSETTKGGVYVKYQHVLQGVIRNSLHVDLRTVKVTARNPKEGLLFADEYFLVKHVSTRWLRKREAKRKGQQQQLPSAVVPAAAASSSPDNKNTTTGVEPIERT